LVISGAGADKRPSVRVARNNRRLAGCAVRYLAGVLGIFFHLIDPAPRSSMPRAGVERRFSTSRKQNRLLPRRHGVAPVPPGVFSSGGTMSNRSALHRNRNGHCRVIEVGRMMRTAQTWAVRHRPRPAVDVDYLDALALRLADTCGLPLDRARRQVAALAMSAQR
jgi:hypothetical protein